MEGYQALEKLMVMVACKKKSEDYTNFITAVAIATEAEKLYASMIVSFLLEHKEDLLEAFDTEASHGK